MNACFFDMFHDASDIDIGSIAKRININLDSMIQKPVNQHRIITRHNNGVAHIAFQIIKVMHYLHRPPAKHIGRPDNNGQTNTFDNYPRFISRMSNAVFRL